MNNFFAFAGGVYHFSVEIAKDVFRNIANERPELAPILLDPANRFTLRLLNYINHAGDDILAQPHYDRGGVTLHVYESEPGLEYLDYDIKWKPLDLQNGLTVAYGSYQFQTATKLDVQHMWH